MSRRPRFLFGLAAISGLTLAAISVVEVRPLGGIPSGAVATVNGMPIGAAELERAVRAVASDREAPFEPIAVLDRLVDEELLVQRALELGLERHDRSARTRLVEAMVEAILAERPPEPTQAEVERFYEENRSLFARTTRVRVDAVRIPARGDDGGDDPARRAAERLRAGEPREVVERELGSPPAIPVPDGLLPVSKLREYVGPTIARAAARLEEGEVSEPIRSGTFRWVLRIVERVEGTAPPFAEIEREVRVEMSRRDDDRRLREYLDDLRDRADVRIRGR